MLAQYLLGAIGGFWIIGASLAIRQWAQSISTDPWAVVGLYALAAGGVYLALVLPAVFIESFVLPHRYGLSTRSLAGWAGDYLKSLGFVMLAWVVGLELLYWLLRTFPSEWWLLWAALLWLYSVAMTYLLPVAILPVFFKLRPLQDYELVGRLTELCRRAGVQALGVYVIDLSSRTSASNAGLVGLGRTRRIVLADTLLASFTQDEIETVLAHEIAHHVHGDIPKKLAVKAVALAAVWWLTSFMLDRFTFSQGSGGLSDIANLPAFGLAILASSAFNMSLSVPLSKRMERAADLFALRVTGKYDAFKSAMIKLANQNLENAKPSIWSRQLAHTHPPIIERLQLADVVAGRATATERPTMRGRGILVGAVPLLLLAVLVGPTLILPASRTTASRRLPAASWPALLAVAQWEAARVDKQAVLQGVSAGRVVAQSTRPDIDAKDAAFEVDFYFIRPGGSRLLVKTVDVDPPRAFQVVPNFDTAGPQTAEELQSYERALATISLSPREVYRATLTEGQTFGKSQGEEVHPYATLVLSDDWQEDYGIPTGWEVEYAGTRQSMYLWLDPQNGKVLARDVEDNEDEYEDGN